MERLEIIAYPNQVEAIKQVLNEFQVPYIRTKAESYGIECLCYTVMVPNKLSKTIVEALASKIYTNQKTNIITHYKAESESTVSEYLEKYEKFLDEINTQNDEINNIHNCWNRLKRVILGNIVILKIVLSQLQSEVVLKNERAGSAVLIISGLGILLLPSC